MRFMPIWLHIPLAILITVYFLFRFIKDKQIYELLFVIWVPLTLVQYISSNPVFIRTVGVLQVIMFILVIFFMFRKRENRGRKTEQGTDKELTGNIDYTENVSNENLTTQDDKKDDSSL